MAPVRTWASMVRRWLDLLAFRGRLMLAFLVLVVFFALATVIVGDLVFGRKVVELASSKAETGLKLTQLYLKENLQRLELLANSFSDGVHAADNCHSLVRLLADTETHLDFVIYRDPESGLALHRLLPVREDGALQCTTGKLARSRWDQTQLHHFMHAVRSSHRPASGLVAVSKETLTLLDYNTRVQEGLMMVAAIPNLDSPGTVLAGALLNGRGELASTPLSVLWPAESKRYAATYFLRDRRVATSIGLDGMGTRVDPKVFQAVLEEGNTFVGEADVNHRTFHAAYSPLLDYRGEIVGMLGIGAEKDVYTDIRNRTIALFATFITVGMLLGILMTFVFARWLMRPLGELAEGMNRVAGGDRDYKVRVHTGDELGQLARAFNLMVKGIRDRDVALQDAATQRLSQVEKQVSVGRLAAGVAHEINNPMTSILTLSSLMLKHTKDEDQHREDLGIIVEETTRCREIVRSLLDFARERPPRKQIVDVNDTLRDTLVLTARYDTTKEVKTQVDLAEELLWVNCDSKQLQQVFTNIITNAGEAAGPGGTVTVASDDDSSGSYVQVKVTDDGPGIAEEHMDRIFEPFYTTKAATKGTGLGLSISLGIIQKHKGSIDVESRPGKGTTVTVLIPRVAEDGAPVST